MITIISNPNGYYEELDKNEIVVLALSEAINKGNVTVEEILIKINK